MDPDSRYFIEHTPACYPVCPAYLRGSDTGTEFHQHPVISEGRHFFPDQPGTFRM